MADRTTSHAKTVQLESDAESLLDRYPDLRDRFKAANAANDQTMVEEQGAKPELRPPAEIARPVDREAHQNRMAQDDQSARAKALLEKYDMSDRTEADASRNRSRDDDYSQEM